MRLIIDGYNLIHAAGILGHGVGPGSLERARKALLNCLVESLEPKIAAQTIVVFDAADAPPLVATRFKHGDIQVRFARGDGDADRVIEELIRVESAPRRLTVVSSDHRLHRAARRRRAQAVDSDRWFAQLLRDRKQRRPANAASKPSGPPSKAEVKYWLAQFSDTPIDEPAEEPQQPKQPEQPAASSEIPESKDLDPIFPPEYIEDMKRMLGEE